MGRSIHELEEHPQYSIINFDSAVVLFLKDRLLKEHWAVIVSKPDQADKDGFQRIDVQSVSFFFSSRRRHTRSLRDWSSDVCSSDLDGRPGPGANPGDPQADPRAGQPRSEERRVGKECRSRWAPERSNKRCCV